MVGDIMAELAQPRRDRVAEGHPAVIGANGDSLSYC
jgi:hypothetical protein